MEARRYMPVMPPTTRRIFWLAALTIAALVLRFGTAWFLLRHVEPGRFDPHGFGLSGDLILLSVLALPLLILLWWILQRRAPWRGLLATATSRGRTAISVVLLVLIGAPTPNQLWTMKLLPLLEAWPVLLSALAWFTTCAVLRALAVSRPSR